MERIYLVGYMGSGKSTIGKALAKDLGFSFIDLDSYIERRYLKKISEIFEEHGEDGFRKKENCLLREISDLERVVISTGGGAACFYDNMDLMNKTGVSVYLRLSLDTLVERLKCAKAMRPLIQSKTDEELPGFIQQMLDIREPFYNQATYIVDNNTDDPTIAVKKIEELLKK